jgi:hypothetical protein
MRRRSKGSRMVDELTLQLQVFSLKLKLAKMKVSRDLWKRRCLEQRKFANAMESIADEYRTKLGRAQHEVVKGNRT